MDKHINDFIRLNKEVFERRDIRSYMFCFGYSQEIRNRRFSDFMLKYGNLREERILLMRENFYNGTLWENIKLGYDDNRNSLRNFEIPVSAHLLLILYKVFAAVKFNRPDWGLFYLIGEAKAMHNDKRLNYNEFEFIVTNVDNIPLEFSRKYFRRIEYLCNELDLVDQPVRYFFGLSNNEMRCKFEDSYIYKRFPDKLIKYCPIKESDKRFNLRDRLDELDIKQND